MNDFWSAAAGAAAQTGGNSGIDKRRLFTSNQPAASYAGANAGNQLTASYAGANAGGQAQHGYSPDDIMGYLRSNNLVNAQGAVTDPHAVYRAAQQYGVSGSQLDRALGLQPGTADNWIQQNYGSQSQAYNPQGQSMYKQQANSAGFVGSAGAAYNPQGQSMYKQVYRPNDFWQNTYTGRLAY